MRSVKSAKKGRWLVYLFVLTAHFTLANNENLLMNRDFYYLKITAFNCEVECYLNGFPVYQVKAEGTVTNQIPVNLYLVGRSNRLDIRMRPLNGTGSAAAGFYRYTEGEIVSANDVREGRQAFTVTSAGEAREATFSFDNDRFNFSHLLLRARIMRIEQVKAYAAILLRYIRDRDIKKLLAEMQPRVRDYALAFSVSEELLTGSLEEQLTEILSHKDLKISEIEDVEVVPYNEGRLWELTVQPGMPFISVAEESATTSLEIFVAMVDGELKIVR